MQRLRPPGSGRLDAAQVTAYGTVAAPLSAAVSALRARAVAGGVLLADLVPSSAAAAVIALDAAVRAAGGDRPERLAVFGDAGRELVAACVRAAATGDLPAPPAPDAPSATCDEWLDYLCAAGRWAAAVGADPTEALAGAGALLALVPATAGVGVLAVDVADAPNT